MLSEESSQYVELYVHVQAESFSNPQARKGNGIILLWIVQALKFDRSE